MPKIEIALSAKHVLSQNMEIPGLCKGYAYENIFNMDETGLFFKDGKRSTYCQAGKDCAGRKRAKDRITVASCVSKTCEKLTPPP